MAIGVMLYFAPLLSKEAIAKTSLFRGDLILQQIK
jgi:hypothetical protein